MLSKLWGWIAAIGASMLAAILHYRSQRDDARQDAEQQVQRAETTEATRDIEQTATEAQADARKQTVETQRTQDERDDSERPSGNFRR